MRLSLVVIVCRNWFVTCVSAYMIGACLDKFYVSTVSMVSALLSLQCISAIQVNYTQKITVKCILSFLTLACRLRCCSIRVFVVGCTESSGLTEESARRQCIQCNMKKQCAKRVSDLSNDLYFAVFVKVSSTDLNNNQ